MTAPGCPHPGCGSAAGDPWCYTATRFRRAMHAARRSGAASAENVAGKLAGRRPSQAQHRILAAAVAGDGTYEVSGYRFHGDAQRRAAMTAMADVQRGWFRKVRDTDHGTVFEVTADGRAAHQRYEDWMNGVRR